MNNPNQSPNYRKQKLTPQQLKKRNQQLLTKTNTLQDRVNILESVMEKWQASKKITAYGFETVTIGACLFFDVTVQNIMQRNRRERVVMARHSCMWFLKKHGIPSLKAIGTYYNHRDHSTVINAIASVDNYIESRDERSEEFRSYFMPLENFLEELDNLIKFDLYSDA